MIAEPTRIAMWSGPRNLSTAMMRSWGNRPDTIVCDEPLYAYYLVQTGKPHPGADEVIASQENDWRKVVESLTGPVPEGKRLFFQKHMTHHLLDTIDRGWLGRMKHFFLIRHPAEVAASYLVKHDTPTLEDLGYPQQWEIFAYVQQHVGPAPTVDASDIRKDPRRVLGLLCDALGVEFSEDMLSWPPGLRATDGVWARHWYTEVEHSTTFRPYQPKTVEVPPALDDVYRRSLAIYEKLYEHRLH